MKKFGIIFGILFFFCGIFFLGNMLFTKNIQHFSTLPSDENIFTQGLEIHKDQIFISSGAPKNFPQTESALGFLDMHGNFVKKFSLNKDIFFGEGITILHDKIYFITWKNQKGFILNRENFEKISEFTYENIEGWGLTNDGEKIFMSDGTDIITIFDENFHKIANFSVTENDKKIIHINEMEYIDGFLFANIWLTNDIVKIDIKTGKVIQRWNFDFIKNEEFLKNPIAQEMNGIAFDKEKNKIIITGKMWKHLYIFDKKFFDSCLLPTCKT